MCLEYVDNVPLLGLVDTGGNVFVINADTLHILERIYNQEISTWGIAICKTFGNLAISDNSHKVKVFNFQNQDGPLNVDKLVLHHRDNIPHVEFSPNGYQLVSVSIDTTCIVWDLITGQPTDIYQLNSW